MTKPERIIQNEIRLAASECNYILWRNNRGKAWQGNAVVSGNTVTITDFRLVDFGLCDGSSDLIGYKTVTVTPEMVGQTVAVFAAVEVKSATGRATKHQKNFLRRVHLDGGISVIARSPEDLV